MTNSNQKERFQTKIAMLEQNNQALRNKCEEYLGELADTKKKLDRYEKVLEKIAKDRKIISMTGYDFDNEIYVNAAREALGLPFDMPEYDDVE